MSPARSGHSEQPGAPAEGLSTEGAAGTLRMVLRVLLIVLALILAVPLHYFYRLFARHSPLPRLFLASTTRLLGLRVRVHGTPLRRDVFFLPNHVSWLDIPALAGVSGTAFVAKAEVADTPVIGWLCRLNRTVFVRREARLDVAAQVNAVREALGDNHAITVFPEGTTTDGWSLLPFKSSILKALEPPPPGVLVQPVLIDYGAASAWIAWIGDESGLANASRILRHPGPVDCAIHFLAPFAPAEAGDRKAIAAEARRRIEAALIAARGTTPRPFGLNVDAVRHVAPSPAHDRAEGED